MKTYYLVVFALIFTSGCMEKGAGVNDDSVIASGQMPTLTTDRTGKLHMVYGTGDSILYCYSSDGGKSFSHPALVSVLNGLAASHMRGPQIASTTNGLLITACMNAGNVFSFIKDNEGSWKAGNRVNDIDTMAKENLMALSADGENAFAVWLDLREGHNKLFGAMSMDGGKTWSKNRLVYASPDSTVCECCKPSVVVRGNNVYVLFRNWFEGNRDLYLIRSDDSGISFGKAEKLGNESWALNGCPMDGGALIVDKDGNPQTVWNRKGGIYTCKPGSGEVMLGMGRSCTMESINGKNIFAWVEKGKIVVLDPNGLRKIVGSGELPFLKAINNDHVLCVWENEKKIHKEILSL